RGAASDRAARRGDEGLQLDRRVPRREWRGPVREGRERPHPARSRDGPLRGELPTPGRGAARRDRRAARAADGRAPAAEPLRIRPRRPPAPRRASRAGFRRQSPPAPKRRNAAAVASFAGKNDSIASSASVTSTGVPNTVVVLKNVSTP